MDKITTVWNLLSRKNSAIQIKSLPRQILVLEIIIFVIGGFGGFDSFSENRIACDFSGTVNDAKAAEEFCWNYPKLYLPKQDSNLKGLCANYVKSKNQTDGKEPSQYYVKIVPRFCILFSMVLGLSFWWLDGLNDKSLSFKIDEPEDCKVYFYKLSFQYKQVFQIFMLSLALYICLNILCVIVLDFILDKQFTMYGLNLMMYFFSPGEVGPHCQLFPTTFGCSYPAFQSDGSFKMISGLCHLNINVFNQFFYGTLWYVIALQMFVTIVTILYWCSMIWCPHSQRYKFIGIQLDDYNVYKLRYVCKQITFYEYFVLVNMVQVFNVEYNTELIKKMYEVEHQKELDLFNDGFNMG